MGNAFGVASLVLFAVYLFAARLPGSAFVANLRGISLLLVLPLSLIAGWKGSRLWWLVSAAMLTLSVLFYVTLSRHS